MIEELKARLKLALALPLSRKVLVALGAGALAWANKRFDLGIPDEQIKWLVGLAAFVILGIAVEDHAEKTADGHKAVAQIDADSAAADQEASNMISEGLAKLNEIASEGKKP